MAAQDIGTRNLVSHIQNAESLGTNLSVESEWNLLISKYMLEEITTCTNN